MIESMMGMQQIEILAELIRLEEECQSVGHKRENYRKTAKWSLQIILSPS
jgi:hypothetical protein